MNDKSSESFGFGYFGKLPQYADFIKHKAGIEEFAFLDDWLQKGIASARLKFKNDWKSVYTNSNTFDFFFPVIKNNNILAGVLFPGTDKSGREFPFVIFSILPGNIFNTKPIGSIPLILNRFYYQAKQLYSIAKNSTDVTQIISEFNKSEVSLQSATAIENVFNEYLTSTSVAELINRINSENVIPNEINLINKKSFLINFNTDDENYNFDCGFFILVYSLLNKKESLPFIFKSKTDEYRVNLFVYSENPDPNEYSKMISNETNNEIVKLLMTSTNQNISLKEFIDQQH